MSPCAGVGGEREGKWVGEEGAKDCAMMLLLQIHGVYETTLGAK